jgi:hypothetical protein
MDGFFSRRFLKPSRKKNLQTVFSKPSVKKFIMDGLKLQTVLTKSSGI